MGVPPAVVVFTGRLSATLAGAVVVQPLPTLVTV